MIRLFPGYVGPFDQDWPIDSGSFLPIGQADPIGSVCKEIDDLTKRIDNFPTQDPDVTVALCFIVVEAARDVIESCAEKPGMMLSELRQVIRLLRDAPEHEAFESAIRKWKSIRARIVPLDAGGNRQGRDELTALLRQARSDYEQALTEAREAAPDDWGTAFDSLFYATIHRTPDYGGDVRTETGEPEHLKLYALLFRFYGWGGIHALNDAMSKLHALAEDAGELPADTPPHDLDERWHLLQKDAERVIRRLDELIALHAQGDFEASSQADSMKQPAVAESDPLLSKLSSTQQAVMQAIREARTRPVGPEIIVSSGYGRTAVYKALGVLESNGMVYRPEGKNSGYALTAKGERHLDGT